MVVVSLLHHAGFGPNDHRKAALHCFDCVLNFVLVMHLRATPANIELQDEFEKRFGPLDMAIGNFMATKRFSPLDLAISDFVEQ